MSKTGATIPPRARFAIRRGIGMTLLVPFSGVVLLSFVSAG